MKNTIFVTTDFTASARNALAYACQLTKGSGYTLVLVHVYATPAIYSMEGVVIASIREAFADAEERLKDEMEWVLENYPDARIEGKAMLGGLVESLTELIDEYQPELIIMGAVSNYASLWEWDSELLSALTGLPVPVLLIPGQFEFTPVRNIGFACDYRTLCSPLQISIIKRLTGYTGAQLHVIHVTRSWQQNDELKKKNEALLQQSLLDLHPQYHTIEDPDVIEAAAYFAKEYKLDILMAVPRKHDFWYRIFHPSYTKQLARLNNLPIMTLREHD